MAVTRKNIADLELEGGDSMQAYYNYIVLSKINGNYSQVRKLFKAFSKEQRIDFLKWLLTELSYEHYFATDIKDTLRSCFEAIY